MAHCTLDLTFRSRIRRGMAALALSAVLCAVLPVLFTAVAAGQPDYRKGSLQLLELCRQGKFEEVTPYFDDKLAALLSARDLKKGWGQVTELVGPFREAGEATVTLADGNHVVDILTHFERGPMLVRFAWDAEGALAGFRILPPPPGVSSPGTGTPGTAASGPAASGPAAPGPAAQGGDGLAARRSGTVPPAQFREEKVELPGVVATFTVPKEPAQAAHPVVLLIADEGTTGDVGRSQALLADVSAGLAERGIASMRLDNPPQPDSTVAGLLRRMDAALGWLKSAPGADAKKLYVAGHGLGGDVAALLSAGRRDIAGVALLSAPARPIGRALFDEMQAAEKTAPEPARSGLRMQMKNLALYGTGGEVADTAQVLGLTVHYIRDFERRDAAGATARLQVPLFVAHAEADTRATEADYDLWGDMLAGRPKVTFREYAGADHFFRKAVAPAAADSSAAQAGAEPERPLVSGFLADLAQWVRAR